MIYKLFKKEGRLREMATMKPPQFPGFECTREEGDLYSSKELDYRSHLASLKEYIIEPEAWKFFEEGAEVKEGEFVLRYQICAFKNEWFDCLPVKYSITATALRRIIAKPANQSEEKKSEVEDGFYPGKRYHRLFSYLHEHEFTALKGEMDDIIQIVEEDLQPELKQAQNYKAILENLYNAVPKQTNDADWWPDELTSAMENAKVILEASSNPQEGQGKDDYSDATLNEWAAKAKFVQEKDQEIERLKGLIKVAFGTAWMRDNFPNLSQGKRWQQFKTENNL